MLKKTTALFDKLVQRYLPDAFVFAIILTGIVFGLCLSLTPYSASEILLFWGQGLDDLFKFAMEMVLILVTGHTLAQSRPVRIIIDKLAGRASSSVSAVFLTTLVSTLACWINWGFGLVVAGLFAVELAKKVKNVDFGLLVAASYSGFLVWHGGLSGSIPLKLTSPSQDIVSLISIDKITLSETIFSNFNIGLIILHLGVLLVLNTWLAKKSERQDAPIFGEEKKFILEVFTPAQKLENSKFLALIISLVGLCYLFMTINKGVNLELVILFFLFGGLLFHLSIARYLHFFGEAVRNSSGIIIQFPLYAGIMAMMRETGFAIQLSEFFVSLASEDTFLLFTYWSAGLVNFFVPSGGGQWALQAPIILNAARVYDIDPARASMAIAWGDAWSNMVQPFWALPLLSVAKIPLGKMMVHSVKIFVVVGLFSSLYLYLCS